MKRLKAATVFIWDIWKKRLKKKGRESKYKVTKIVLWGPFVKEEEEEKKLKKLIR